MEQYLSGPAIEAAFASRIYAQIKERPTAPEIFALAAAQDPIALAVVKQYKQQLAKFLASLTQFYDPSVIVLGGGLSLQDEVYVGLAELMEPYLFIKKDPPLLRKHALGDSAGVIGAALLAYF